MKCSALILGCLFLCIFCTKTFSLPSATFEQSVYGVGGTGGFGNSTPTTGPAPQPVSASSSGFGYDISGTATTSASGPTATASGSITASSTSSINAISEVIYYAEITGGSLGDSVPTTITGNLDITPPTGYPAGSLAFAATNSVSVIAFAGTNAFTVFSLNSNAAASANQIPYSDTVDLTAGTMYGVIVYAAIDLSATSASYTAMASADPTFTLDPSEIAEGYSIEIGPGVISVPEPSIPALVSGGAGILIFSMRPAFRRNVFRKQS